MTRSDDPATPSFSENVGANRSRFRISRRTALAIFAATSAGGCAKSSEDKVVAPAKSNSSTVPLRILLAGEDSDAESLRAAWVRTHEKPLAFQTQSIASFAETSDDELADMMDRVDVAILPQASIERVTSAELVTALRKETLNEFSESHGQMLPAAESGLGIFAGATQGVAVGAKTLAVLAVEPELNCRSWSDYHDWVATLDGKAAEPLGPGWAADSFLNRCVSTVAVGWLFNRASMRAEINREPYVLALEQLAATAELYSDRTRTPGSIWQAIRKGELLGGIGYAVSDDFSVTTGDSGSVDVSGTDEEEPDLFDVSVFDCPVETETDRIWFSPDTPIACLSSASRQTDASKRFIGWLTGGEQINSVWQQTDRFSRTRIEEDGNSAASATAYSRWLQRRLQIRQVMPGLVIPGGHRYYETLDRHVRDCLDGKSTAAGSLSAAADEWAAITNELGRQSQSVAWKRALGFGG